MIYPVQVAAVLRAMGYRLDVDYELSRVDGDITISAWRHSDAQPTPADIDAAAVGVARSAVLERLAVERNSRADAMLVPGGGTPDRIGRAREQLQSTATRLLDRRIDGALTASEEATRLAIQDAYAALQALTSARDAIYQWAAGALTTAAEYDAIDAAAPPPEAPQWP